MCIWRKLFIFNISAMKLFIFNILAIRLLIVIVKEIKLFIFAIFLKSNSPHVHQCSWKWIFWFGLCWKKNDRILSATKINNLNLVSVREKNHSEKIFTSPSLSTPTPEIKSHKQKKNPLFSKFLLNSLLSGSSSCVKLSIFNILAISNVLFSLSLIRRQAINESDLSVSVPSYISGLTG
jgi:hypothetical protein